jgi:hypothetical protein
MAKQTCHFEEVGRAVWPILAGDRTRDSHDVRNPCPNFRASARDNAALKSKPYAVGAVLCRTLLHFLRQHLKRS